MMSPTSIIVNNTSTIDTTPLTKPKRPLSSYNLFYRFKRQHIIELQSNNANKDQIMELINQSPGLEDVYSVPKDATPEKINEIRKANIVNDMKDNLSPRETAKRRHRKNKNAMNGEVVISDLQVLFLVPFVELEQIFQTLYCISFAHILCSLYLFRLSLMTWPV